MRPGRAEDMAQLIELWRREVTEGRQDIVPNEVRMRRMLGRFDWEARSRVVEQDGRIAGSVLVTGRPSPDGTQANLNVVGPPEVASGLVRWALQLSHAAGAGVVQTFMAQGRGEALSAAGMRAVRPWWRMDRSLQDALPDPKPVPGYEVIDGTTAPKGSWSEMFNLTFADHWRFAPRSEEEITADKAPDLCLMAVTSRQRSPAAITIGEIEEYAGDPRPQPVGLISSVGTLPGHRRRGLAGWLVAEVLRRLRNAGARHASLYVDGENPMRAHDAYRKLGFEVTFEAEVWEATLP